MADPSIVNPGDSSYSLPAPTTAPVGEIPQMNMERVLPRQTSTGLARGVQQLGSPNVYVDSGNEQIIVAKSDSANTSVPQVLMGNQTTFGEGFYVTKSGVDATTATSLNDFIFNSNQNVFKIVDKGVINLDAQSFTTLATSYGTAIFATTPIQHNLNYTPAVVAYGGDSGGIFSLMPQTAIWQNSANSFVQYTLTLYVDSVHIYLSLMVFGYNVTVAANVGPFEVSYYLLQETANIVT